MTRPLKAYADNDMKSARSLVQQAQHAEPREALFHALLGDINARGKRYDDAQAAYTRAITMNPNYFQGYLGRGLVRQRVNKLDLAATDLSRSIELLPTATAHNALGEIESGADTWTRRWALPRRGPSQMLARPPRCRWRASGCRAIRTLTCRPVWTSMRAAAAWS
jgi:tetratricopeptide (TPR) repeat protein